MELLNWGPNGEERITIKQGEFSVLLTTEQTNTQKEVFLSIEEARGKKRFEKIKQTGIATLFAAASILTPLNGYDYINRSVEKGDSPDKLAMTAFVVTTMTFVYITHGAIRARGLAKRQLDRLLVYSGKINSGQEQLPPLP